MLRLKETVNYMIREVNHVVFQDIEDVVAFVNWLDGELCFLIYCVTVKMMKTILLKSDFVAKFQKLKSVDMASKYRGLKSRIEGSAKAHYSNVEQIHKNASITSTVYSVLFIGVYVVQKVSGKEDKPDFSGLSSEIEALKAQISELNKESKALKAQVVEAQIIFTKVVAARKKLQHRELQPISSRVLSSFLTQARASGAAEE